MQRALLSGIKKIEIEDVPSQASAAGEARVSIAACGICGSDLHMYDGSHPVLRPPLVMGHEFVGRVAEVGSDVTDLKVGDRVIGMAGRGCGECEACQEGHYNWCEQLKVIGGHIPGALAEGLVLPACLKALGAGPVVVSDISAARRELAHARGTDVVIDPRDEGAEDSIK